MRAALLGRMLSGRYEVLNRIGGGGMGDVHRARDHHLQRDVTVKVLPERFLEDEKARRMIRSGAHALARRPHPNIVGLGPAPATKV